MPSKRYARRVGASGGLKASEKCAYGSGTVAEVREAREWEGGAEKCRVRIRFGAAPKPRTNKDTPAVSPSPSPVEIEVPVPVAFAKTLRVGQKVTFTIEHA